VNIADPGPLVVLVFATVGLAVVAQQTPFSVILPPPSELILPPEAAVVAVIAVIPVVVTVGITTGFVVKVISLPYAVPALLVAYERT
jgi:hypothetical protein